MTPEQATTIIGIQTAKIKQLETELAHMRNKLQSIEQANVNSRKQIQERINRELVAKITRELQAVGEQGMHRQLLACRAKASQSAIDRVLRSGKIQVSKRAEGRWVYYSLTEAR
jgi:hypothetical protein